MTDDPTLLDADEPPDDPTPEDPEPMQAGEDNAETDPEAETAAGTEPNP